MYIDLLVVAHVVVAVLLILVVLLQRSESNMGALGGSNAVFTGKSVSGILTKATTILAILFMTVSLLIVRDSYQSEDQKSVVELVEEQTSMPVKTVDEQEPALPNAE